MRILVIEDDEVLVGILSKSLKAAGHKVDVARTLTDARRLWRVQPVDVVLLDLNLPESADSGVKTVSGLEALREARARGDETPVLVLTAQGRTDQRIEGLNAGADGYLCKPCDLAEIEARLRALVRLGKKTDDRVQVGQLTLDRKEMKAYVANEYVFLPRRELAFLWELMTPPGVVVSKKRLSDKLSEAGGEIGGNALEAIAYRLKQKISGSNASIRALRGLGYVLENRDGNC